MGNFNNMKFLQTLNLQGAPSMVSFNISGNRELVISGDMDNLEGIEIIY